MGLERTILHCKALSCWKTLAVESVAVASRAAMFVLVVAIALMANSQTAFADRVGVRIDRNPGIVRLMLDWPRPVVYSRSARGNITVITFERTIDARWGNTESVLSEVLDSYKISEDGQSLLFTKKAGINVRTYSDGPSVVIDFIGDNVAQDLREIELDGQNYVEPPSDAPEVAIIGASTEDKTRVVLQWAEPQEVSLERDGSVLRLMYNIAARVDKGRIAPPVLHSLNQVKVLTEAPRLLVELNIAETARVEQFNVDAANVIDIFKPLDLNVEHEIAKTETGSSTIDRGTLSRDAVQGAYTLAPTADVTGNIEERLAPKTLLSETAEEEAEDSGENEDLFQENENPQEDLENEQTFAVVTALVKDETAFSEITGDNLTLDIGEPAALAAFNLGQYFWIVSDKKFSKPAEDIFRELISYFESGDVLEHPRATLVRFKNPDGQNFRVAREGTVWTLTPISEPEAPFFEVPVATNPRYSLGARVIAETSEPGKITRFFDPELRQPIFVVPLKPGGQATKGQYSFADFTIEPAFQGIVIRPLNLELILETAQIGIIITAPEGLALSDERPTGTVEATDVNISNEEDVSNDARALIDPQRWARGGRFNFVRIHSRLLERLTDAEADQVNARRLQVAQFLFGYGLFHEAIGVLNLMIESEPDIQRRPAIIGLRAAALAIIGRSEEALEIMEHPEYSNSKSLELWRGVAYADQKRWQEASRVFRENEGLIQQMPEPIVNIIGLMAIESYIEMGWVSRAFDFTSFLISEYPDWALGNSRLIFLSARATLLRGDRRQAIEFFKIAATGEDRLTRLRAGLKLSEVQLELGEIKPRTAAKRLERIRFAWRGDEYEFDLLERLGQLHIDGKNYSEGFSAWRYAIDSFPQNPRAKTLSDRLYNTFKTVLSTEYFDEDVDTLAILKLFNDYQELTPPGREGDIIVLSLISRLIQIDLLGDAADLLEHQALNRSSGVTRKRMGTRLAALRLLDNHPELALEALEIGGKLRVSRTLEEERTLLRARSLADLGEIDQAYEVLKLADSREAELLKVDIAWRARDWEQVVSGLNSILPLPPSADQAIDPELSSILLNLAVANAILDRKEDLATLRNLYGLAMDSGPDAAMFRLITRGDSLGSMETLQDIETRISETDIFSDFLENIKNRDMLL